MYIHARTQAALDSRFVDELLYLTSVRVRPDLSFCVAGTLVRKFFFDFCSHEAGGRGLHYWPWPRQNSPVALDTACCTAGLRSPCAPQYSQGRLGTLFRHWSTCLVAPGLRCFRALTLLKFRLVRPAGPGVSAQSVWRPQRHVHRPLDTYA